MRIAKIILLTVGALIIFFGLLVSFLSPKKHVERSVVIQADPTAIFPYLTSFRDFNKWSPFNTDPTAVYTFEGPERGPGSKMSWTGKKAGVGSQQIISTEPYTSVVNEISFDDGDGQYTATFILSPTANGTQVTWSFDSDISEAGFISQWKEKAFNLMLDKFLGPLYEEGLQNLKELAESSPPIVSPEEESSLDSLSSVE